MIVAQNKKGLGILTGVLAFALALAGLLVPEQYMAIVSLLWLPWLLLLSWLGWSIIAPIILSTESAKVKGADEAFENFEASIAMLSQEQANLRLNLQTAQVYHDTLIDLLVGFIEQAAGLERKREALTKPGAVSVSDPKLFLLLNNLEGAEQQMVINAEVGSLEYQEMSYRMQAKALLSRVMSARGQIANESLKLETTNAAIPLLQMNNSLQTCQAQLVELNQGRFLESKSVVRRMLSVNK
jgi:hypothetical protein